MRMLCVVLTVVGLIVGRGERADEFAQTYHTIYEALCNRFGANNIIYEPGVTYAPAHHDNWWEENKPEIGKAVAAAHQADVIVACIGENTYCETPGNLNDLHLSSNQIELVKGACHYRKADNPDIE